MLLSLFGYLGTCLLAGAVLALTILVSFGAPVASYVGYSAIEERLRGEPLPDVGWFANTGEMLRVVGHYIDRYGADTNVLLAIGGCVVIIPGFYIGVQMLPLLGDLLDLVWPSFP